MALHQRLATFLFPALVAAMLVASVMIAVPGVATAQVNCNKKNPPPECEIPETPWALILPAGGAVLAIGFYLVQRRRNGAEPAQPQA